MPRDFVIADIHFGHQNIITYENRPFINVEEMDKQIVEKWNRKVSKEDRVFILGDVSFCGKERTKELVSQLNGHKVLVMGNHDRGRKSQWWLDVGMQEVSKYPIIIQEFLVLSHEPPTYFNNASTFTYLYGHVHSCDMYKTVTENTACVSMERWDYIPVEISKLIELMKLA